MRNQMINMEIYQYLPNQLRLQLRLQIASKSVNFLLEAYGWAGFPKSPSTATTSSGREETMTSHTVSWSTSA